MVKAARIAFLFSIIFIVTSVTAAPVAKKTKITFDQALPEDISNENFPNMIESFDYPNADILDLVKAVGKLTGLNFIVDSSVSGKKITVIAPSKITVAEAYKAFLSALAINGYALVKSGAFWKIQETKKALKDNTEIYSGSYFPNTDQLITRIIKLNYIDAKEFADSIKYLLSQNNQISHHASSNSVIISDYGSVIERIMKIVYVMDASGSEEKVTVIPIEHAAAENMADMLSELIFSSGSKARSLSSSRTRRQKSVQKKQTGHMKISSIIADTRTNSIIVSSNKEGLNRVKELIKELDTYVDPSRTGGVYVYNVLYGTAEQVYNTLMGIEAGSSSSRESNSRRSSFNFSGRSRNRSSFRSGNKRSSPLFENVTILPDVNTNSLIISAKNKYDFERVKEVLKKIDVPRDQVFVQAIIVEMLVDQGDQWEINLANTLDSAVEKVFGVSGLDFLKIGGKAPIAGFLNRSFSANPNFLQNSKLGPGLVLGSPLSNFLKSSGLDTGNTNSSEQLRLFIQSDAYKNLGSDNEKEAALRSFNSGSINQSLSQALNLSIVPLLQLLKKSGNVNVLSTPQITALDNITASIEVGENAPVGLTSTSSSIALSQNSVDREDVTLKLEITPRINPDSGTVQMDISQKFDDFSERRSTASELQSKGVHIVKRNIETKMVLHDGETAVLGGLLTDKETHTENKVPILGDIPVFGWLFKGFSVKKEKRNLVVFITPTIIKGKKHKNHMRNLLSKKLEERIHFVKTNMKGRDPHGYHLKEITAQSKMKHKTDWKKDPPASHPKPLAPKIQNKLKLPTINIPKIQSAPVSTQPVTPAPSPKNNEPTNFEMDLKDIKFPLSKEADEEIDEEIKEIEEKIKEGNHEDLEEIDEEEGEDVEAIEEDEEDLKDLEDLEEIDEEE